MSSVVEAEDREPDGSAAIGPTIIAASILVAAVVWVFWGFFHRQLRWAFEHQADWGHTLVIPVIAGYFVYLNREKLAQHPFRTAWLGLVPMILGVGWYMFCSIGPPTLQHHNIMAIGVAATIFGLVLLMCGYRAMLILWFPLAYLFLFGQTISDRFLNVVTFTLQDIAAHGSFIMLTLMGLDVERAGNTLTILFRGEEVPLNIAEACSGMRMLMAFLALGVAMAYIGLKRYWQRIVLVILAVPTAIFVNMLRVVTLGLLSLFDTDFAAGDFHTAVGLVWLIPAFVIYLGLMWIVLQVVIEPDDEDDDSVSQGAQSEGTA